MVKSMPKVLLLTPPMTQVNTPYPATAYLTGFLRKNGVDAVQADPALDLVLRLFSRQGMAEIGSELAGYEARDQRTLRLKYSPSIEFFLTNQDIYQQAIEPVVRFLQGKDPSFALRLVSRTYLP